MSGDNYAVAKKKNSLFQGVVIVERKKGRDLSTKFSTDNKSFFFV